MYVRPPHLSGCLLFPHLETLQMRVHGNIPISRSLRARPEILESPEQLSASRARVRSLRAHVYQLDSVSGLGWYARETVRLWTRNPSLARENSESLPTHSQTVNRLDPPATSRFFGGIVIMRFHCH